VFSVNVGEFRYVSNILSLLRMILVIPIYYFLRMDSPEGSYLAVLTMLVAAVTDTLDGTLARKLGQKSDLGRILDPVADKIAVTVMAVMLVKLRALPLWFVVAVIVRDAVILLVGLFLAVRKKVVVESNMLGKITVTIIGMMIISYTLRLQPASEFLLWVSVALLVASSLSYTVKVIKMKLA